MDPRLQNFARRLLAGLLLAALFAVLALRNPGGDDARFIQHEFLGMGTLVHLSAWLPEDMSRETGEQALLAVEARLRAFEQDWSAWGEGALGQLNAALARGESVQVPAALQSLFTRAAQLSRDSGGLFDARIGALVQLWGFDDAAHYRSAPPAAQDIAALRAQLAAAPAYSGPDYGPAAVRFDFGAIAKGEATDLAMAELMKAGIADAIVNAGGNLRARGQRGPRPWNIGIRHPRPEAGPRLLATLKIQGDEAVITSGDYERHFEFEGRRYHHLLDPRSGEPAQGLQSVTVVAADAALADAASTALFVAGPAHWRETAARLGLDQVLVVDAAGRILATPRLHARLVFGPELSAEIVP